MNVSSEQIQIVRTVINEFLLVAENPACAGKVLGIVLKYARRRTRDSVEEQRHGSTSSKDLRDHWYMSGEDCAVIGGDYSGENELDFFIANPATAEERDWASLQPSPVHE